ncbi:MAG: Mur ligase family protein, partial [Bacteroidota bacterium]|nr:Mur ligase family protein [Bacteroidota bacterium]
FFAITAHGGDGHRYLGECYARGVRSFVIEKEGATESFPENAQANILLVTDAIDAMQRLAGWHRGQFQIPVIGITGSNGKTIVKEWLYELSSPGKSVVRSPKSYNSQIGVPLSVWQLQPAHEMAIFEAGISQRGEMERLETVIKPTIGIITNIGAAHQGHFHSLEEKIDEKLALFRSAGMLIYPKDYDLIAQRIEAKKQKGFFSKDIKLIGWSKTQEAALR